MTPHGGIESAGGGTPRRGEWRDFRAVKRYSQSRDGGCSRDSDSSSPPKETPQIWRGGGVQCVRRGGE
jgi:hypothetical protein